MPEKKSSIDFFENYKFWASASAAAQLLLVSEVKVDLAQVQNFVRRRWDSSSSSRPNLSLERRQWKNTRKRIQDRKKSDPETKTWASKF